MSDAIERFLRAVSHLDIEPEVTIYPAGTRTATDAAAAVGCDVGQIVKSLVFAADGSPILALTSGANRVDTAKLAEVGGFGQVGKADAEQARAATGFSIGGTPPFGHATSVPTFIDRDLLGHEVVYAAAGRPDTCFPIAPATLVAITNAPVADFAER